MNQIHEYAARIDYDLWMDITKVKNFDAGTTSINSLVNEGLRMVRDQKMEQISQQRRRRESLSNW
jgi:hypothetical protein